MWKALPAAVKAMYKVGGKAYHEYFLEQRPLLPTGTNKTERQMLLRQLWNKSIETGEWTKNEDETHRAPSPAPEFKYWAAQVLT